MRYTSLKSKGEVSLCGACYSEGRFPSTMHSGDFVRLDADPYAHAETDPWSDQETLLLLEGIEMHDEDWDKVADHVGTRTKEQCIAKFLKLPIEDGFLAEAGGAANGPYGFGKVPLSKTDNPVMSVVAFLAGAVDKKVAAKAAGEAIDELEKTLKEKRDKPAAPAGGDAMEVDGTTAKANGEASSSSAVEKKEMEEDTDDDPLADSSRTSATSNIQKAALTALGSAAAKAHALALEEDASLHSLVTAVVEAQVRKLDLKLKHFEELEQLVEAERRAVEVQKQEVFEDRVKVARMLEEAARLVTAARQNPAQVQPAEVQAQMAQMGYVPPRAQPVQNPGPAPAQDGAAVPLA